MLPLLDDLEMAKWRVENSSILHTDKGLALRKALETNECRLYFISSG